MLKLHLNDLQFIVLLSTEVYIRYLMVMNYTDYVMWIFSHYSWRHNDHDSVSNHQPHGCLLNRLFRRRSHKTSKLRVTGPLCGEFTGTGEFPAQRASYAENVSIWWRHHDQHQNKTAYGRPSLLDTLRPRQSCRHFADNIFRCIFSNENVWISITITLKLVS